LRCGINDVPSRLTAHDLFLHGSFRARCAHALRERAPDLVFAVLVIASLLVVWGVRYVPTQDGPIHLYNALIVRDYNRPDRAMFREFFRPNHAIVPNMLCPQLLPLLTRIVPAAIADKLLLTFYLIAFPFSVRYALGAIDRRATGLAALAAPWALNEVFYYGFQDFFISLVGYFFVAGFWFSRRRRFGNFQAVALGVLVLLLYLTHLVSTLYLLPLIGICALYEYVPGPEPLAEKIWRLVRIGLAMLPVVLLALWFILQPHGRLLQDTYPHGWAHRFGFVLEWMQGFKRHERWAAGLVCLLMIGGSSAILFCARRKWQSSYLARGLAVTFFVYVAVFLVAPDALSGGSLLSVRVAMYPNFALLLWWAAMPIGPQAFARLRLAVLLVSVAASAWLIENQFRYSIALNRYLAEYDAIPAMVPEGSTFLPVHYEEWGQMDIANFMHNSSPVRLSDALDPFRHAEMRGLAERGIIDLANHWASTDHQTLSWQPGLNPMTPLIDGVDDFLGYSRRTGVPVDFVLVRDGGMQHADSQALLIASELRLAYRPIYTSPTGNLTLYRLTKPDRR
jgi:hypothetical protein